MTATIFVLLGIFFVPQFLKLFVGNKIYFDLGERIFLWMISIFLISSGILTFIFKQKYISRLIMVMISILMVFIIIEFSLRIGFGNFLTGERNIWVPLDDQIADYDLNKRHSDIAFQNEYGFNDINHSKESVTKNYRIAILGDSFVWGHGVEDSVRWTKKFEYQIKNNHDNIEILHWGQNAWSSYDQFNFMIIEGYKYKPDLLINTFVINDPVKQNVYDYYFLRRGGFIYRNFVYKYPGKLLGNALSLIFDYSSVLGADLFGVSYDDWLREIYSEGSIKNYKEELKVYRDFLNSRNIDYFFLFTPENNSAIIGKYFTKITSIMDELGIPYYNLFPEIEEYFNDMRPEELWASPVNNHPGNLVTQKIAELTSQYVVNKHLSLNAAL